MEPTPPVSVQDVLGAAGEPPGFTWRGKQYKLGFPDGKAKARLEELICQAETAAVQALRAVVTPAEFAEHQRALGRMIRTREYRTRDGLVWHKYMLGEEAATGFQLYLLALLREFHPELTEDDVRNMLEEERDFVLFAADRVVPGFFTFLVAERALPAGLAGEATERFRRTLRQLVETRAAVPAATTR